MKALLIVDVQNDFMPSGALGVPNGEQIIPVINRLTKEPFDLIVATKDWHPRDHGSFAPNQGLKPGDNIKLAGVDQILWPIHCVQGTVGSEFADGLDVSQVDKIFYKGIEKDIDSYSAFCDNAHHMKTGLGDFLKEKGVTEVYIVGLATDYCVKYSVMDSLSLGFKTCVIKDGCRGIDLNEGDVEKSLDEMERAGAVLTTSNDVF